MTTTAEREKFSDDANDPVVWYVYLLQLEEDQAESATGILRASLWFPEEKSAMAGISTLAT